MAAQKRAIGLMSGTSLDGIDAAIIETDGKTVFGRGTRVTHAYSDGLRDRLKAFLGRREADEETRAVERDMTLAHAEAVAAVMAADGLAVEDVAVIGFHGQTLFHAPKDRFTWQIGDGALLAKTIGIPVVADFRSADVAAGGEGAPFAPVYHRALSDGLERPLAVLNLGGVGNVTWFGSNGEMIAFDTGPGNAPLDRWVERHTGARFDRDGALARAGWASEAAVARFLEHPYFAEAAPKSLDRTDFDALLDEVTAPLADKPEDGAATLLACTVASVTAALDHVPDAPKRWLVTGGGRHNPSMMGALSASLGVEVGPVEDVGWDGDALEAECFAFLAVRHLQGLPLSFPGTTGVPAPMPGGVLFGG